jgi:hypothetical protein
MPKDVGTGSSKCIGSEKPYGDGTKNDNATNAARVERLGELHERVAKHRLFMSAIHAGLVS